MGTSKNVASPDSPPWKMARATLGRPEVPVLQQNREIWRSVQAERGPEGYDDFAHPTVAAAGRIASESINVQASIRSYEEYVGDANRGGFAIEIAKRALARTVHSQQGVNGFAQELFAEATSYYASRDLPSFVGGRNRVPTTSAAIELKNSLKEVTRTIVRSAGKPPVDPKGWATYVDDVFHRLRGAR